MVIQKESGLCNSSSVTILHERIRHTCAYLLYANMIPAFTVCKYDTCNLLYANMIPALHTHTCMHTHTHTHISHTHVSMHTHIHAHVCMHAHVACTHTCTSYMYTFTQNARSLYFVFPGRAPANVSGALEILNVQPGTGRTAGTQAGYQLAFMCSSVGISIFGGILTGKS